MDVIAGALTNVQSFTNNVSLPRSLPNRSLIKGHIYRFVKKSISANKPHIDETEMTEMSHVTRFYETVNTYNRSITPFDTKNTPVKTEKGNDILVLCKPTSDNKQTNTNKTSSAVSAQSQPFDDNTYSDAVPVAVIRPLKSSSVNEQSPTGKLTDDDNKNKPYSTYSLNTSSTRVPTNSLTLSSVLLAAAATTTTRDPKQNLPKLEPQKSILPVGVSNAASISLKVLNNLGGRLTSKFNFQSPGARLQSVVESVANGIQTLNMDIDEDIVTLEEVKEAYQFLRLSPDVVHTPTLAHVQGLFTDEMKEGLEKYSVDLYLKMENMQTTGSFKIRGVLNQMRKVRQAHGEDCKLVTMSAGNYGKAFAHCVGKSTSRSVCVMPKTAPAQRFSLIKSMGVEVLKADSSELQSEVNRLVENENFVFCHPFDDVSLIAGYASSAIEVLEVVPDPDIIVVCCGGGGLVSGVAAAISLHKIKNCRVYAVEPEGAPTMYESYKKRRAVTLPDSKSVAAGLSPPYAGSICYKHCHWFVDDVLLVSDAEILNAMRVLYDRGIKAEPSGCAAFAALLTGKIPDVTGKKVVVYITGGNVSPSELSQHIQDG